MESHHVSLFNHQMKSSLMCAFDNTGFTISMSVQRSYLQEFASKISDINHKLLYMLVDWQLNVPCIFLFYLLIDY
ncbi:hypothetical protein MTR67_003455 [Solanum verrucosum]|uniref:Uncharacterized protein n=1 Tax=Solanum verrucosum TaxID=315347 RepID=A0AAF0PUC1_SOLVR|nr:hypothetical protein MTR67_003455 [Solanum verrucosum]